MRILVNNSFEPPKRLVSTSPSMPDSRKKPSATKKTSKPCFQQPREHSSAGAKNSPRSTKRSGRSPKKAEVEKLPVVTKHRARPESGSTATQQRSASTSNTSTGTKPSSVAAQPPVSTSVRTQHPPAMAAQNPSHANITAELRAAAAASQTAALARLTKNSTRTAPGTNRSASKKRLLRMVEEYADDYRLRMAPVRAEMKRPDPVFTTYWLERKMKGEFEMK